MEIDIKKQTLILGLRIGILFFFGIAALFTVVYIVMTKSYTKSLTEYTTKMLEVMTEQGADAVERELTSGRAEAQSIAKSVRISDDGNVQFQKSFIDNTIGRVIYASKDGYTVASEGGAESNIARRSDVAAAFDGETSVYGPRFTESGDYIVCYTAPVYIENEITGALIVEKSGYIFSNMIKDIRFTESGESYIINEKGTDIAVSDLEHIEWIERQYNAHTLPPDEQDEVSRSVVRLEEKGLAGESGADTFKWYDGERYCVYAPISSSGWVITFALKSEQFDTMTKGAVYRSLTSSPIVIIMTAAIFLLLIAFVLFWIFTARKKDIEINKKLNIIANYDSLTGAMNQNSYQYMLNSFPNNAYNSLACIYIDVNGLHEINNHLGHNAGDQMLKTVALMLKAAFPHNNIYRIGGDEFVLFCQNDDKNDICKQMKYVENELKEQDYEISYEIEWRDKNLNIKDTVNKAEAIMLENKREYYRLRGSGRQSRVLNTEMDKIVAAKQDADIFISLMESKFKGVYFVNLSADTSRHLCIPDYFQELIDKSGGRFSKAIKLYSQAYVAPEYRREFEKLSDFNYVGRELKKKETIETSYKKNDGTSIILRILKLKSSDDKLGESLWVFSVSE